MMNKLKNRNNGIKSLEERMCFEEEDSLGYAYQAMFSKRLVYARLFEGFEIKKWVKFITYFPGIDANA